MYAVQQPLAGSARADVMSVPSWKSLPSWYLVAEGDQAIPPDAERMFAQRMHATTTEARSNHVANLSHPRRRGNDHRIRGCRHGEEPRVRLANTTSTLGCT